MFLRLVNLIAIVLLNHQHSTGFNLPHRESCLTSLRPRSNTKPREISYRQFLSASNIDDESFSTDIDFDDDMESDNFLIPENNERFQNLISSVGLEGKVDSIKYLPSKRPLSSDDIFCNRELKLSTIKAIGFDMDHTLVQYKLPAFDKLSFNGAKEKLVKALGYPKEVLDFEYDHTIWTRGLVIDTKRGNFLKIDRHKYVRVALHGLTPISSNKRKLLYSRDFSKAPSFDEKEFVNMDTLFHFVDASLFASLVQMKDSGKFQFLNKKEYQEIYRHVRECVDLCHRDGVIKDEVAKNPEKYMIIDEGMIPMLREFRNNGVKVFLLTNSYWEHTSVAMNYLYHEKKVDEEVMRKNEWMELFDIIVVGACKPAFLVDPYLNLFRVIHKDGSLLNTDGLFEIEAMGENGAQSFLKVGNTFQGGNWKHLTALLEAEAGEQILYVGDHLYSDVLRSKRELGWRSVFIMPEIVEEMEAFHSQRSLQQKIIELRKLRDELSLYGDLIRRSENLNDPCVQEKLSNIALDDEKIKNVLTSLADMYHGSFHHIWGMMFQAGYQDSRFAYFVQNYACLYTAKASNIGLASTSRSFRTSAEMLPHDKLLSDDKSRFLY